MVCNNCGCEICEKRSKGGVWETGRTHVVKVGEYSGMAAVLGRDLVITIPFDGSGVAEFVLRGYVETGQW